MRQAQGKCFTFRDVRLHMTSGADARRIGVDTVVICNFRSVSDDIAQAVVRSACRPV